MFKVIARLENIRRTPGAQGRLAKLTAPGGIALYMSADHSGLSPFPTTMKIQWDGDLPDLKTDT